MNWLHKIKADNAQIVPCISHYEKEYTDMRKELSFSVGTVEKNATRLPAIMEHVYTNLQEIESVLEYLNIQLRKVKSLTFKKYLENYQRALTTRDADRYVDGDSDVVEWSELANEFALIRNKYLSLSKGLEQKGWMISHVTKLRCAGLEDITID